MLGRTDRRLRLVVLLLAFALIGVAAVARLSYWTIAQGPLLRTEALAQLERTSEDQPLRGDILDRNGTVLATTSFQDQLVAYPGDIPVAERSRTADLLVSILELRGQAASDLRATMATEDPYVVVARRLTDEQSRQVRVRMAAEGEERLVGVALEPRASRFYPNIGGAPGTTLASHLLGFVTEDGTGHYGIEQAYDPRLGGQSTRLAALRDPAGQALESSVRVLQPGRDGEDVRLTIDASLQLQLEKELYAAWVADKATRVSAVILDPWSGDVLAWASVPGYDANDYARVASASPGLFLDPIASEVYEPGSIMKMLTAAAALQEGVVTMDSRIADGVALRFGADVVQNFDGLSRGRIPFRDAVAFSRNVAMARVAARLDRTVHRASLRLHDTWARFGLGQPTGIDLPNELRGLVADPAETTWQPVDLANRAFGQGVAVTQIQLAVAYAAMVNGGRRVTPRLVAEVGGTPTARPAPVRIVGGRLANELRQLLSYVTQRVPWYREGTRIPGFIVGGKTGTAQIWDARLGAWAPDRFNFSFVGYVGTDRPQAVIATRIHEVTPRVLSRGVLELGIESYELFRRIAVDAMTIAEVEPLPVAPEPPVRDRHRGRATDEER